MYLLGVGEDVVLNHFNNKLLNESILVDLFDCGFVPVILLFETYRDVSTEYKWCICVHINLQLIPICEVIFLALCLD